MDNCSKYVSDKTGSVVFVRKNNQIICSETWGNAYRLIFQTKATVEYIDLDSDYSTTRVDAKADAANFAITIFVPAEFGKDSKLLEITYSLADGISKREVASELSEEIGNQTREKPLVYIDGAIPTTKDNVLATMTVKSQWLNIFAYIKIKCQGSSSMSYPKKNFTVTLYQDAARTIPLEITIPGWKHASNKFVLKANYIDHLHARNIISAQLWSEIVASRPDYDALPEKFRNSPNNGAVDGFPTIVYTNGNYQGVYTWNIGKDAWLWGMDEDNPNHVLMCAETNTNGTYAETPCNFRALWSGVNEEYWSVEVGENSDAVKTALNDLIGFVMNATDEEFVEQAESYLDVQSAIDYYLFACASCGIDNLGKNMLLGKYDVRKWMLGQYDLDSTWGLWWDGSKFIPATTAFPDDYQEEFSLLFERIVKLYKKQLVDRGLELRKNALSGANIISHFERFVAEIGAEVYADDLIPYPSVPSADSNNIWQIRNFVSARLAYYDAWLSGLMDVEYDTPYPIKDGVYNHAPSSMTISSGNHVKVDIATNEVYANLSDGVFNKTYLDFAYSKPLFALKAGDVVTRKLTNITVSDDIRANRKWLSLNMIGENGEIKFGANVSLETVGSEVERSVTIADDVNIGYLNMWIGSGAGAVSGTIEFDLYLYVNGERYV